MKRLTLAIPTTRAWNWPSVMRRQVGKVEFYLPPLRPQVAPTELYSAIRQGFCGRVLLSHKVREAVMEARPRVTFTTSKD